MVSNHNPYAGKKLFDSNLGKLVVKTITGGGFETSAIFRKHFFCTMNP